MTAIASPLKWHGGKSYLASKIVALMPKHIHYVEPYAGGLSVLLAKDPEGVSEVVNDLNGELMGFWNVLRDPHAFEDFQRACMATPFAESLFHAPYAMPSGLRPLIMAAWVFFIRCRQSLAGRMKDFAPLTRKRTRRKMNEQASAWLTTIEGLPEVHERLQRVVVLSRDAVDVICQQDGPDTLFYCDPPYLHETRSTTGEYKHEMTADQHIDLLTTLAGCKGKWMLSGYDSKLYESFFRDFTHAKHTFDLPNNSAGGKTKRRMTECVWCNF